MKSLLFILWTLFSLSLYGQSTKQAPVIYLDFDKLTPSQMDSTFLGLEEGRYLTSAFMPTLSKGLKGLALDLTENVPLRIPEILAPQMSQPDYNASFAIQIWVYAKKQSKQGTPIASNMKVGNKDLWMNDILPGKRSGWQIGTKENGAWFLQVSDGESVFSYEPTPERQSINDEKWHQLTISINREKKEMWIYYDGKNVAIYNIDGLKSLASDLKTVIGGCDEYIESSSRGEYSAFNGMIDEVRLWNRPLTAMEVSESYSSQMNCKSEKILPTPSLKIQVWNIWHGGRRYGQYVGLDRVVDVLKGQNADIIGLIETYGSGAIIADALGYYYYLISSNLSILSRYPIEECFRVFNSFNSGGAIINLGNDKRIAFYDIWLDYRTQENRITEIDKILSEIKPQLDKSKDIPVIMVGDFNSISHLDQTEENREVFLGTNAGKVSERMLAEKLIDSYRKVQPNPSKSPGRTIGILSNPAIGRRTSGRPGRIDYIYFKSDKLLPYYSQSLVDYLPFWPSDHGSVTTCFYWKE